MEIPILINHDYLSRAIGWCSFDNDGMVVTFNGLIDIDKEKFFDIFGNVGFSVIEGNYKNETLIIQKARIFEFSLSPLKLQATI